MYEGSPGLKIGCSSSGILAVALLWTDVERREEDERDFFRASSMITTTNNKTKPASTMTIIHTGFIGAPERNRKIDAWDLKIPVFT